MKLPSFKSFYMNELKKSGITKIDGKSLKSFKTHVVANAYFKLLDK